MKPNTYRDWYKYADRGNVPEFSLEVFGFETKGQDILRKLDAPREITTGLSVNSYSMSVVPDGDCYGGGVIPTSLSCSVELSDSIKTLFYGVKKSSWRYTYSTSSETYYFACIPKWKKTVDGVSDYVRGPIMWLVDMQKDALSNRLNLTFYDQLYQLNFTRATAEYGVQYTYRSLVKRLIDLIVWPSDTHSTKGRGWYYGTISGLENIPEIAIDDFYYGSGHPLPSDLSSFSQREALSYILAIFGCYLFQSDEDTFKIGNISGASGQAVTWFERNIKDGKLDTLNAGWSDVEVISIGGLGTKKTDYENYIYSVSGNPFVRDNNYTAVSAATYASMEGQPIRSGEVTALFVPVIEPGDFASYTLPSIGDEAEDSWLSPITSIQWDGGAFAKFKQSEPKEINNKYW